jgi:hypothetical protein
VLPGISICMLNGNMSFVENGVKMLIDVVADLLWTNGQVCHVHHP